METKRETAKRTPGPWCIHQTLPEMPICILGPEPGNAILARMDQDESRLADARLIAAAPELLEACKRFAAWIGDNPTKEKGWGKDYEVSVADQARAAIARAEGR